MHRYTRINYNHVTYLLAFVHDQEQLLTLAKEVANSTQALVQHVKEVAQKCEDKTLKAELVTSTKRTATSTSQLVACTKVSNGDQCIHTYIHVLFSMSHDSIWHHCTSQTVNGLRNDL